MKKNFDGHWLSLMWLTSLLLLINLLVPVQPRSVSKSIAKRTSVPVYKLVVVTPDGKWEPVKLEGLSVERLEELGYDRDTAERINGQYSVEPEEDLDSYLDDDARRTKKIERRDVSEPVTSISGPPPPPAGGGSWHYYSSSSSSSSNGRPSGQQGQGQVLPRGQSIEELLRQLENSDGGSIRYYYSSSSSSNRGHQLGSNENNYERVSVEDLVRQGYDRQTAEEMVRRIESGRDFNSGGAGNTGGSGGRYYYYHSSSSSSNGGPRGDGHQTTGSMEGLTVDDLVRQGVDRQRAEEIINHIRNAQAGGSTGGIRYYYSSSSSSSSSSRPSGSSSGWESSPVQGSTGSDGFYSGGSGNTGSSTRYHYSSSSSSSSSKSSSAGGRNNQYTHYSGPSKTKRGTATLYGADHMKNSKRSEISKAANVAEKAKKNVDEKSLDLLEKIKRTAAEKSVNSLEKHKRSGPGKSETHLEKKRTAAGLTLQSSTEKKKRSGHLDTQKRESNLERADRDYFPYYGIGGSYDPPSQSQPWSDPYYRSPYDDKSSDNDDDDIYDGYYYYDDSDH